MSDEPGGRLDKKRAGDRAENMSDARREAENERHRMAHMSDEQNERHRSANQVANTYNINSLDLLKHVIFYY